MSLFTGLQRLYELNGNALDSTGNANGTEVSMAYTAGKFGQQAGTFPNVAGRRVTAAAYNPTSGSVSIAYWCRQLGTPSGAGVIGTSVLQGDGHPGNNNYWLSHDGTLTGGYSERHFGNVQGSFVGGVYPAGTWVHSVWVLNYATLRQTLYINGTIVYNLIPPGTHSNATGLFYIGGTDLSTAPANADLQQIGIWNRELSQAEVNFLYNSGNGRAYPFYSAPTITRIVPNTGGIAGGTFTTITGTNFTSDCTVSIGGAAATSVTFVSSTTVTCVTPPGALGIADVRVTNGDAGGDLSVTLAGGFTYTTFGYVPATSSASPYLTTYGSILASAKQESDMLGSNYVTDDEWCSYICGSYKELYGLITTHFGNDYFVQTPSNGYTFTTDGISQYYALPSDFFKLLGVDLKVQGQNTYATLKPFTFGERNKFGLVNSSIPMAGQTVRLFYIPRISCICDPNATIDGVNGWEEYIVIDAAIKALSKGEQDVSVLMMRKQAMLARLQGEIENRDAGSPARVSDVMGFRSMAMQYRINGNNIWLIGNGSANFNPQSDIDLNWNGNGWW